MKHFYSMPKIKYEKMHQMEDKMETKPEVKYKKGDVVLFQYIGEIKSGTIVIVDAQGTFFQQEEPSYDIEVTEDLSGRNGLYKHIQQSWILSGEDQT